MINYVSLTRFKQIEEAALPLGPINVLVGGNNSGKSCILQGIHFGIALAQARREAGLPEESGARGVLAGVPASLPALSRAILVFESSRSP